MKDIIYKNRQTLPGRREHLYRKHIDRILTAGLEKPLITVCAGAGFGKTQAVAEFLSARPETRIWVQLSDLDNLAARFWDGLVYRVSLKNEHLAEQMEELGFPDSLLKVNELMIMLDDYIGVGKKIIMVFDDFHLIYEKQIHWLIENVLFEKPHNICVILISRQAVPFEISSFVNNNQITAVTVDELRFSYEETKTYLDMLEPGLEEEQVEKIYFMTEGWPVSVNLAGIAMVNGEHLEAEHAKNVPPFIGHKTDLRSMSAVVFELIDREVFAEYTSAVQNLLGKLAYLESFEAGLVHKVAGPLAGIIPELSRTNMFITYNPYTEEYHFHHLFLQFLKKRYNQQDDERKELYRITGEWYEEHKLWTDALMCYIKSDDVYRAWDIIQNLGMLQCSGSTAEFLLNILEEVPENFDDYGSNIALVKALLLLNNYKLKECAEAVGDLERELRKEELLTDDQRRVLGEVYIIKAMLSFCNRGMDIAENFKKACGYLPDGKTKFDYSDKLIDSNFMAVMNSPAPGELKRMEEMMFETIPYTSHLMGNVSRGRAYLCKAEGAYYRGDLEEAESHALKAVYRGHDVRNQYIICHGHYLLMRIAVFRGDFTMLEENLEKMEACAADNVLKEYPLILDMAKGWLYCKLRQPEKIESWIVDDNLNHEVMAPVSTGRDRIVRAHYFLHQGRYEEVIRFLQGSDHIFVKRKIWPAVLLSKIMQSIACFYLEQYEETVSYLKEAYDVAKGNELYTLFVEYGNYNHALFGYVKRTGCKEIPVEWVDMIHKKSGTYAKRIAFMRMEYMKKYGGYEQKEFNLNKREQKVLEELCQGMTRNEIAEANYISLTTVKITIKSVYEKLDADNLADAIRIALTAGLVS